MRADLNLELDLGKALEMVAHAAEDIHQGAALLAGFDHVDIEVGKNDRLLGHGLREALALGHVLLELAADVGGDALGFQMGHAVEGDGQGHAGFEEIGQLIGEGGHFLHARFALLGEVRAQAGRQELGPGNGGGGAALGGGGGPALGDFHRHGEQTEAFDLHQRRAAIGHFEDACNRLAIAAARLVLELGHNAN